ncbi:pilus assembly protein TadG-related protein [Roseibium polysiphoniae]|uniref:VWA domain-containing protein n=1 Tax=Roseibium polysiphoniae TaxID=2571221 RepID=A0A944GUP5_9HYPH|nr:pilus assembly protein TadG-related protein [Roseibium polysiphoniae]MBS8261745.1 VWA domain-containing protein [Roseibium polysiphoniae]
MLKAFSRRIARSSQKLVDDTRGAILPIFAMMSLVVIVVAGAGIDYGRAINDREVMANALDAAALAVAAELSTTIMTDDEIEEMLEEVFAANLSALGLSAAAVSNMDFTVNPDEGVVSVSTSISVPTYFIGLGGIGPDSIDVASSTEVNYSKFDVELALVLDVTGSMGGDIGSLKTASQELLDTLIPEGTSESDSKVRISMIPYSEGVNLGSYASTVTNGSAGSRNCVTEREGDEQFTDATYDYDDENSDFFGGGSGSSVDRYGNVSIDSVGDCSSSSKLIPLTSDRDTLEDAIDDLSTNGRTAGQTGIAWGWYTLSPNWADLWPSDSEPAPYGSGSSSDEALKFAILMTDGDFNNFYYKYTVEEEVEAEEECEWVKTTYTYTNWKGKEKTKTEWVEECEVIKEAYTVSTEYWVEEDNESGFTGTPSVRAKAYCDAMKEKNISIYSIYFDTGGSGSPEKVMEYCADDDDSFYYADSQDELINAFGNIAKKIQSIYLAK